MGSRRDRARLHTEPQPTLLPAAADRPGAFWVLSLYEAQLRSQQNVLGKFRSWFVRSYERQLVLGDFTSPQVRLFLAHAWTGGIRQLCAGEALEVGE